MPKFIVGHKPSGGIRINHGGVLAKPQEGIREAWMTLASVIVGIYRKCRRTVPELTGELVPGFLDGLAQRGVVRQRLRGDPDPAGRHIHVDIGYPGELADLGLDRAGTMIAAHAGDRDGASFHGPHRSPRPGSGPRPALEYGGPGPAWR